MIPGRRAWATIAAMVLGGGAPSLFLVPGRAASAGPVGFSAPVVVDQARAGGEPSVIHSSKVGDLVYSAHEGTTHLDREGAASGSVLQFLCPSLTTLDCYKNHVWIWTSDDGGRTWQRRDQGLTYPGFSDPDLTEDASGLIYDTGIDLANDALFSSPDGGRTWPHGTFQCHEGDRPWLAGGAANEVFLTTDTEETGHTLFHSGNAGDSCDPQGIPDNGTLPDGTTWSGFGKGVYDRVDGSFIEPARFVDPHGNVSVGISRLPHAADAFRGGGETFQPVIAAPAPGGIYSPFGAPEVVSMDSAENIYLAWDSDDRDPTGTGGCSQTIPNTGGGPTPLPNHIWFVAGRHVGPGQWQFTAPISLAHQGNARVLWPWSVAGAPGMVSVVWYQMDTMVDPDCDLYDGKPVPNVETYIYEAHISNATDPARRQVVVSNASGRPIHEGGICDSGTTCVATGQDRRLGDYFTNAIDGRGCVIIASGDTTMPDPVTGGPRVTSLPIFIAQSSGQSLLGGDCASAATSSPISQTLGTTAPPGANALPQTRAATSPWSGPAALVLAALAAGSGIGIRRWRRRHPRLPRC